MIIAPEVTHHAPHEMIRFYKKNFGSVHVVHCKHCKNTIAIELSQPLGNDTLGLTANAHGIIILPVDERLLSSRVRTDGMLGYQCICGNDTRSFDIEEKHSPLGDFLPHQVDAIQTEMSLTGWQAPVKHKDGKEHRDSFTIERV